MYKVSEYSNNNQEREDPASESTAIDIDTVDGLQSNDYSMSADEDISEKQTDTIIEEEGILEIEDELLSSGEEEMDTELNEIETRDNGDNYRNSVVEFNSEDEIENLEEDGQTLDKETNNAVEEEKSDYLSNDSLIELDELNNYPEDDDVQEIPAPSNKSDNSKKKESIYSDQKELIEIQKEDLNGNGVNKLAENKENKTEVNPSSNQERFEELNVKDQDKGENDQLTESNYKEEEEEEEEEEERERNEMNGEEEREEEEEGEEREIINQIEEESNAKIMTEPTSDSDVHENETGREAKIEEPTECKNESNKIYQKGENISDIERMPNLNAHSKIPNSKFECTFPIIINIAETDFLLVPFDKHKNPEIDVSHLVSLYDDHEILKLTIEDFFGLMRTNEDLNEIHQFTVDKELVLVIPELNNLSITEDNIYSRDITIEDFVESFENLKSNSINAGEEIIQNSISFLLTSQTRFITNFNNLSERIREGKGFSCISLKQSAFAQTAIEFELSTQSSTENLHKRQSLSSSDETETQQTKRVKISI